MVKLRWMNWSTPKHADYKFSKLRRASMRSLQTQLLNPLVRVLATYVRIRCEAGQLRSNFFQQHYIICAAVW